MACEFLQSCGHSLIRTATVRQVVRRLLCRRNDVFQLRTLTTVLYRTPQFWFQLRLRGLQMSMTTAKDLHVANKDLHSFIADISQLDERTDDPARST